MSKPKNPEEGIQREQQNELKLQKKGILYRERGEGENNNNKAWLNA